MKQYTITEAKAKFSEIIAKAAAGEEIIITRLGKEQARIVPPVKKKKLHGLLGCMKTPYWIADDFNEWPEDIARDLGMID